MAEPFDAATFLEDVSAIVQQQYFTEFTEEYPGRFGSTTNKLFRLDQTEIIGDGRTMQIELAPSDTVRSNTDPLGAFAAPDSFEAGSLKVRFNKHTLSSNDFVQISASAQTDDIDIREAGKGSIVDFVDRIFNQVQPNYDEHLAILRHLPRTAVAALVNGTPTLNNSHYIAGATGTATNAGGGRLKVDNGSIAYFRRGSRLDFINPSTGVVNAGNVRVTDPNPADLSIGIEYVSSGITARLSTGDLANIADNDIVCFSGEYNQGMYSMGAYFGTPTAGESFIGGVDRTTSGYRWLIPTRTREGSTSEIIKKSMFNDLAIAMGFRSEDQQNGMVFMTDPTLHQTLRDMIGEDSFVQIPVDDTRMKRFMNFGSVGLNYQHGTFGLVKIMADPLCPPNTVRVIASATWKALYYGWKGLRQMPGDFGNSGWYRLAEASPNTGKGKIYKADWYALQCDWCTKPWLNGQILNVSAS